MGDTKGIAGEVEGDYGTVKVQIAGGPAGDSVRRPTKGTQVVWGGSGPGSPWAHLVALIEKSGGSVTYTFLHAADLKEPVVIASDEEDAAAKEEEAAPSPPADKPEGTVRHSSGGAEGQGPLFEDGLDFQFGGNVARVWAHPHCFHSGPRPLVIACTASTRRPGRSTRPSTRKAFTSASWPRSWSPTASARRC